MPSLRAINLIPNFQLALSLWARYLSKAGGHFYLTQAEKAKLKQSVFRPATFNFEDPNEEDKRKARKRRNKPRNEAMAYAQPQTCERVLPFRDLQMLALPKRRRLVTQAEIAAYKRVRCVFCYVDCKGMLTTMFS